jgi:hypothetical protein
MRRLLIVMVAMTTFITLGSPAALADGPVAGTDGSTAVYVTSNNSFRNCDTDPDGDWVYVSWHLSNGQTTINENHLGSPYCTYPPTGVRDGLTIYYKSCQNDAFADTCTDWKSTTT